MCCVLCVVCCVLCGVCRVLRVCCCVWLWMFVCSFVACYLTFVSYVCRLLFVARRSLVVVRCLLFVVGLCCLLCVVRVLSFVV